jgi:hypothetical protein
MALTKVDSTLVDGAINTTAAGNVGIGTSNPTEKLVIEKNSPEPFNTVETHLLLINAGGNQGAGNRLTFAHGNARAWVQSLVAGPNSASGLDLVFGTPSSGTTGVERMRIDANGNVSITQAAGRYSIDTTGGSTTVANNGTIDFPLASGMLVVNSWNTGNITLWLCGAGGTTAVASAGGGTVGSLAIVSGINGYRWTNNSGTSQTYGFFFVRTRPGA